MESFDLYRNLGIALALGLLIGVERGWSARGEPAGGRVAGFRTFGLLGLLGGLAGVLTRDSGDIAALLLIAAAAAALIAGYVRDMAAEGSVSATTTIAGLITLALGLLATTGQPVAASICAGVMLMLLAMREELHAWVHGLSAVEVKAVARFALIAVVVWPLLPDAAYGPYDAWNPRELWTVVVLIAGLSFVGYVLSKRLGDVHGTLATAAAGALVSSTAVTAALSRRLVNEGEDPAPLVAGIAAAGAVMMARTLVLTALLAGFALPGLAVVAVPAGIAAAIAAFWALRKRGRAAGAPAHLEPRNPFDILPALGFAALLAAAALFARWAADTYGDEGLGVVLAITGTFDVDAAIVTMGGLPEGTVAARRGAIILAIPILLNTAFKAGIVIAAAGWTKGRAAAAALMFSFGVGAAALAALWLAVAGP